MDPYRVVIIGIGPKGLYAFERLLAQMKGLDSGVHIEVHLFEKTGYFGAGEIYRPDQPEYLIMNYPNRNINVWPEGHPKPVVETPMDFAEWLGQSSGRVSSELADGFSPRHTVGAYLMDCFESLINGADTSMDIFKYCAEVTDVAAEGKDFIIKYRSKNNKAPNKIKVQQVMVTTGHSSCKGQLENNSRHCDFIDFVYPVMEKLAGIDIHKSVGVRGLGLTFIDTVLALTEGRGGSFKRIGNGNLIYLPSGNEPKNIYAFSRSGLPMIPRRGEEGSKPFKPRYFTLSNLEKVMGDTKKINFFEDVLPLFIAETEYRYYSLLFENYGLTFYPEKNLKKLKEQIAIFHVQYPGVYRFNFGDLFKAKNMDPDMSALGALAYMRYIFNQSKKGSESSAFMAAAMTWGRLSETFNEIYSFGGMSADSHWLFDKKLRSKLNRISYGPPVENFEKLIALVETGLVNLDYSENPETKKLDTGWQLFNSGHDYVKLDVLVDARIPTNASIENWSNLFKKMQKNGLIREYVINDTSTYRPGCPEIDLYGKAVDRNGVVLTNLAFYGTRTEGIVYDNDSLSRTRNNFASHWASGVASHISKRSLTNS